jgi:hypothetical protein
MPYHFNPIGNQVKRVPNMILRQRDVWWGSIEIKLGEKALLLLKIVTPPQGVGIDGNCPITFL